MKADILRTELPQALFHLEDGGWKMVQLHASVGAGNRETFGDVLPE